MRRIYIIATLCICLVTSIGATEPATAVSKTLVLNPPKAAQGVIDLDNCFLMAVRHSESLQMKDELINQAAAKFKQALGTALPQITFKANELIQDVPASDVAANPGGISTTFLRRSTPYTQLNLTQPIFSGFKEFRAIAAGRAMQSRTKHEKMRAAQLLYQDVAQSFYAVIQLQNDMGILQRQRGTLARRVNELRERVTVGRSRASEITSAEAQLANTDASLAETRGTVAVAWEMLEFLTGLEPSSSLHDPFSTQRGESIDHFLSKSDVREDVLAAQDAITEASNTVGVAKSGHYPNVALSANYYPYRVGFYNQIKWDTTFTLSLPIFTGGTVTAQVKEAESKLKASTLNEQLSRRQSEKDIRSAYSTWKSGLDQAAAYARASAKNRANFEAQRADYQNNLVPNLEVMQALANWQDSERRANQLKFQSRLNYVQLLVAAGMIPTLGEE